MAAAGRCRAGRVLWDPTLTGGWNVIEEEAVATVTTPTSRTNISALAVTLQLSSVTERINSCMTCNRGVMYLDCFLRTAAFVALGLYLSMYSIPSGMSIETWLEGVQVVDHASHRVLPRWCYHIHIRVRLKINLN